MARYTRWTFFFAILIGAAGVRFWRLTSLPPGFHLDESFEGLGAWQILTDSSYRPIFITGYANALALNSYINALMFGLFQLLGGEAGPLAMRVTAASFGVLGVAVLYGLASELQKLTKSHLSIAFPFFAAASLALMRWHIHFSRIGIEPIYVPLIWTGALWLLLRGWRTGGWLSFAGCGILVAMSLYAYLAAWIIPFLILPCVLLLLLPHTEPGSSTSRLRHFRSIWTAFRTRQGVGLLIALLVACLCALPFILYTWHNYDTVILRSSQVVAQGGTDSSEPDSTVGRSISQTALMYAPVAGFGDGHTRRNIPREPLLNLWQSIVFYLGLMLALWRLRRPGYAMILIGLIGLLLPGALSNNAPHFHRTLGAAAPTALLCAIGLDWIWQWRRIKAAQGPTSNNAQQPWINLRRWVLGVGQFSWISLLLLGLGGATSIHDYFVRWARLPDIYYAFDTGLWQLGQRLAQVPAAQPIYLTPRDTVYPTLAFALRNRPGPAPIHFDGRHIIPLTAAATDQPELYAVIEYEDFRTSLLLPGIFPTATVEQEFFDWEGERTVRIYERPANAVPEQLPEFSHVATLGDGIGLLGYDLHPQPVHAGEILYLQLHWLVEAKPTADWTVFTHVLAHDDAGNPTLVAGKDNPPGENSLPTTRWQPGWRILDEYQIQLPSDLASGEYSLEIGLYQASGAHLPNDATGVPLGNLVVE